MNYKKEICFILPTTPDKAPYIQYYLDIYRNLETVKITLIIWDRGTGRFNYSSDYDYLSYQVKSLEGKNIFLKVLDFNDFKKFIINHLKTKKYDLLIIFGITLAYFLREEINLNYRKKYIFDIRDYSPIVPFIAKSLKRIITNSLLCSISSKAYKSWLPSGFNYLISHNISKIQVEKAVERVYQPTNGNNKSILTIGQLRDYSSNNKIIRTFHNFKNVKLVFSGDGISRKKLEVLASKNNVSAIFTGWYDKSEENTLISDSDWVNIILPEKDYVMTQMTNRFYTSTICGKPMIVNSRSVQSSYVQKFNLGIVVDLKNLDGNEITKMMNNFNYSSYECGRQKFLKELIFELNIFESEIAKKSKGIFDKHRV